jgi:DNA-damage-inducible protein J
MVANALIQTRIDEDIKARASAVLEKSGLTLSDAVRIMLTRTANEGVFPLAIAARSASTSASASADGFDAWFRAKVQEALDDPRQPLSQDDVARHFADRRGKLMAKLERK